MMELTQAEIQSDKDKFQELALAFLADWKKVPQLDLMTILIVIEIFYNTMMIYKECKKKPPAMIADAAFLSRASKYNLFAYLLRRKLRGVVATYADEKDRAELEERIPHFVFDNKDKFLSVTTSLAAFKD